jgi:hypothetical protein
VSREAPRRIDRRTLLVRGGALAGASSLAGVAGYVAARESVGGNGALPASTGRFALDREYVNLTTFLLAPHPGIVREAIEGHRRELDANAALYLSQSERALEEAARAVAAAYLGAEPEQIALTDSTTMGLGLVYARLSLKPGDEVVTTEHEFYATHEALRLRQALDGVTVRRIRLYGEPESASRDAMVAAVAGALGPRTRCLALTWVHSSSGVKLPLREIADAVELANRGRLEGEHILLCLDGCTASASRTPPRSSSVRMSSCPVVTSGSSARAAPGLCGLLRTPGSGSHRRFRASTSAPTWPGSRDARPATLLPARS